MIFYLFHQYLPVGLGSNILFQCFFQRVTSAISYSYTANNYYYCWAQCASHFGRRQDAILLRIYSDRRPVLCPTPRIRNSTRIVNNLPARCDPNIAWYIIGRKHLGKYRITGYRMGPGQWWHSKKSAINIIKEVLSTISVVVCAILWRSNSTIDSTTIEWYYVVDRTKFGNWSSPSSDPVCRYSITGRDFVGSQSFSPDSRILCPCWILC